MKMKQQGFTLIELMIVVAIRFLKALASQLALKWLS